MNHEAIARIAHSLWQEAGQPEGQDLRFWLQAEAVYRGTVRRGWPPSDG